MIEKTNIISSTDTTYTYQQLKDAIKDYITNPNDLSLIEKAYNFAKDKHEGQKRKSGLPYIVHPLAVAIFLAELHAGPETICAGLLHDTEEDTDTSDNSLRANFGETIANLVGALTKISDVTHKHDLHIMAEDHRKIFVAMAKDIRVILIKLCDRLHNMSTLQFQPRDSQIRIAQETLDVYAPIAHRLGLYVIQVKLEDLSLYYLKPNEYRKIEDDLKNKHESLSQALKELERRITNILLPTNIPFQISSRVKSIYSIYKKMQNGHKFDEIYDILALRIITSTENKCYEILGYIHANFKPIPGRFKDYIAMPKPNLYQSLHTTIIADTGNVFEVQIRTKEMDELAEEGVAAHWRYKENEAYDSKKEQEDIENQLHWFRDFVDITTESSKNDSALDYVETLQHDIFNANVYVFTPLGKVICLPQGSTPIDFAYRIHTKIGETICGAKVNNVLVPISTKLKTGDICEIKTAKDAHPKLEWLDMCGSQSTKVKIRKYLSKDNNEYLKKEISSKARNTLLDAMKEREITNVDVNKLLSKKVMEHFHCDTEMALLTAISNKNITPQAIFDYLQIKSDSESLDDTIRKNNLRQLQKKEVPDVVVLKNGDRALMSLAICCKPIPGEEIKGYITKGSGIKVHRADCPNIKNDDGRLIEVMWNPYAKKTEHPVDLNVECEDYSGLLVSIMNTLASIKVNCLKISAKYYKSKAKTRISLTVLVSDNSTLELVKKSLLGIKGVKEINRVTH